MTTEQTLEDAQLSAYALRLSGHAWGISLGVLAAAVLFLATNVLVLKGGENVGQHLGILSQYFWGYDVTFVGSLVGAFWAFAFAYLAARLVCMVYNSVSK